MEMEILQNKYLQVYVGGAAIYLSALTVYGAFKGRTYAPPKATFFDRVDCVVRGAREGAMENCYTSLAWPLYVTAGACVLVADMVGVIGVSPKKKDE